MRAIILIGQVLFSFLWLALLANLVMPFPGNAFALFLLLLLIVVVLHLLQMLIFYAAFQAALKAGGKDYLFIFLFGIVGWMMALQKHNKHNKHTLGNAE
ncbi:hypothetical protein CWE08_01485 [Aliidiomarina iranensis]|uniref:DUF1145 domain-containing protein n=1 Tax=Aliidiomarina iranensis TaxID=1434071 RepID=A0A432W2A6_9GAMM|nr:DUF1145 domain-containing protein [Aliidiomarina iranensis]RUO23349.1 hypothetical protein CWE08_01485 [Aliidiomarina iranensis]